MPSPIQKTSGPCVIFAGAGTGKTHTIVEKIKYLITNKIYPPEQIVCIAFSNEAANNLLVRVQRSLTLEVGKEPIIKTFHSFCADLIRKHAELLEIPQDFKILTPDEAKVMLHRTLHVTPYCCHAYTNTISTAKDLGVTLAAVQAYVERELSNRDTASVTARYEQLQLELQTIYLKDTRESKERKSLIVKEMQHLKNLIDMKKFALAWSGYEKIKKKQHYLDYADLHLHAHALLEKHPEVATAFSYIIVDEFQDTNKIQLDLLRLLTPHRNITIVGDMNQSIYRFRGAYKDNVALFKKYFTVAETDIYTLTASFRSPNKVLRTAHKLILHNYENKEECFVVENVHAREGEAIEVYELSNAKEEARKVIELVRRELAAHKVPEEICIMVRTHQQGLMMRRALEQAGIPYSAVSKGSLLHHPVIKTAIDYLTIIDALTRNVNGSEQAWWDVVYQLGFIEEDLIKVGKFMKEHSETPNLSKQIYAALETLPLSTSGKLAAKVLRERITRLLPGAKKPIKECLLDVYVTAGLLPVGKPSTQEEKHIVLNLDKFLELAQTHAALYGPDITHFLNYLDIVKSLDITIMAAEDVIQGVQLMTLHATKGLEYKTVILTNLAQKRFPLERFTNNPILPSELLPELAQVQKLPPQERERVVQEYERHHLLVEERRLAYVAATRAREKLICTYATEYGGKKHAPSSFLNEINYRTNEDIQYVRDDQLLAIESPAELQPATKLSTLLHSPNFEEVLITALKNVERTPINHQLDHKTFSPSALLTFVECEKSYEYKYVYHMPDRKTISWESMRLGSFVHAVLERGVRANSKNHKDFIDIAYELHLSEDWNSVDLNEALRLIAVFFERNKNKYNEKSKTEQELRAKIGDFNFIGFADRIDIHDRGIEVIDYKTGKSSIAPRARNWQLGFYALAARSLNLGPVRTITLDMLKQEKPLEFYLDDEGNATSVNGAMTFNIYQIEHELIETAQAIITAYTRGFRACSPEKNCEFCNEYMYGY